MKPKVLVVDDNPSFTDNLVEILTPNRGPDRDQPIALPALGVRARPLRFLDFLLAEAIPAAVPYRYGVLVNVPQPARYAVQSDSGRTLLDFSATRTRSRWPQLFDERRAAFTQMFKRRALRCAVLDTADEPENVLRTLLGFDARRKKTGRVA